MRMSYDFAEIWVDNYGSGQYFTEYYYISGVKTNLSSLYLLAIYFSQQSYEEYCPPFPCGNWGTEY